MLRPKRPKKGTRTRRNANTINLLPCRYSLFFCPAVVNRARKGRSHSTKSSPLVTTLAGRLELTWKLIFSGFREDSAILYPLFGTDAKKNIVVQNLTSHLASQHVTYFNIFFWRRSITSDGREVGRGTDSARNADRSSKYFRCTYATSIRPCGRSESTTTRRRYFRYGSSTHST